MMLILVGRLGSTSQSHSTTVGLGEAAQKAIRRVNVELSGVESPGEREEGTVDFFFQTSQTESTVCDLLDGLLLWHAHVEQSYPKEHLYSTQAPLKSTQYHN